jgi:Uma2 family endonuclease
VVRATLAERETRRRLTVDEYEAMFRAGILREDERVELLDGEIYRMAAVNEPHISCVIRLTTWFVPRTLGRALLSPQNPFRLSTFSEPEPDFALLRHRDDFYATTKPAAEHVLLIIEVADTSLRHDRDVKVPLYAAEGIPEVWIADVKRKRLTVYREPTPEGYRQVIALTRRATIAPLAFPDLELRWEDIFGRP